MAATKTNEALTVGIDLGTSRTAISTSTGQRLVVDSFVGWPADMVARKILKRRVLVGREALDNRTMLDLRRPLERGLIKEGSEKDVEAVRELIGHLLSLAARSGGQEPAPVRAVLGVPASTLRTSKKYLRDALDGLFDKLIIVSEPFAVAYGLDALLHTLVIDIGAGTTDFCVMKGRYPTDEDQRTLTVAGDSIDAQLQQLIRQRYPDADFSLFMVRDWKEQFAFVGSPPKDPVVVTAPVRGVPTSLDITREMQTACEALVPPIVETMFDLLASVAPEYQERVRRGVIVSGGGGLIRNLGPKIQCALRQVGGGAVTVVAEPTFVGSDGCLAIACDAPDADWEKLGR
jgi:rod shape-determining protein MreB and related proteins